MTMLADTAHAPAADPAAGPARRLPALARLIAPVDLDFFLAEHWERKPLLIQRNDPGYYAGLVTLADIDEFLVSGARFGNLRIVKDGKEAAASAVTEPAAFTAAEALYQQFRAGHTLVMNEIDGRVGRLRELSHTLAAEVGAAFRMNVYLTPAGNKGFRAHYDTHDVFVMQVHGTKHWKLAGQPYELPLADQHADMKKKEPPAESEFDLVPGDMLYMPRGTLHWATANEGMTAHVTMGVHGLLLSDLVADWLNSVYLTDVRLRRALPLGYSRDAGRRAAATEAVQDVLTALREHVVGQEVAQRAVVRAMSLNWPSLSGHLCDLDNVAALTGQTPVRSRPGQYFRLQVGTETVSLLFHGKALPFPARDAAVLAYITETKGAWFTAADLPGEIAPEDRLSLLRSLVTEGFLTLTRH